MGRTPATQWSGKLDGYIRTVLDTAKEVIKKDWDMIFLVDGYEGSGKSVLAQQLAAYCDPTLNLDRICFNPKDFIDAINASEKYQAVVYDEAYGGMSSRAALSEVNRSLMAVLAEIRQKNLFVFIVMPCFFEMDKYAAVWRSRGLFHVYTGDKFERGRVAFYNQSRKKKLYVIGKKFYNYNATKYNFYAKFNAGYAVPDGEYRAKKNNALQARSEPVEQETAKQKSVMQDRDYLAAWYKDFSKQTFEEIARRHNIEAGTFRNWYNRGKSLENPVLVPDEGGINE